MDRLITTLPEYVLNQILENAFQWFVVVDRDARILYMNQDYCKFLHIEQKELTKVAVLEEVIYPLVPQRRLLDVKEVADLTLYLSSESAKGITGQAVVLDGGYTVQ